LLSFFSVAYDRKVATSAPPAGIVPIGKPIVVMTRPRMRRK